MYASAIIEFIMQYVFVYFALVITAVAIATKEHDLQRCFDHQSAGRQELPEVCYMYDEFKRDK